MTSPCHPLHPDGSRPSEGCPAAADLSRRAFVSTATLGVLATALAAACGAGGGDDGPTGGGNGGGPGTPLSGVTFASGTLTIALVSQPGLAATNGFLVTNPAGNENATRDASGRRANVIVVNTGAETWRAFTSVCTHEGNPVGAFANGRIQCAFHGSQFDAEGRNVVGPNGGAATLRPLTQYAVTVDRAAGTLRVAVG
jgi:Rieske Fe-S protein